jgi:DNA adenine methylase
MKKSFLSYLGGKSLLANKIIPLISEHQCYCEVFAGAAWVYDRQHVFFYLDHPYHGVEDYYGKGIFHRNDFTRLRDILKSIKGKFMMSINNTEEIRKLYKGFNIKTVETSYSVSRNDKGRQGVRELVMNY